MRSEKASEQASKRASKQEEEEEEENTKKKITSPLLSPVKAFSSTRIGSLPCSSASMSLGLHAEKAPEQMNSMWSVETLPCFVATTDPSMIGSRSRWTPSDDASAPPPP